MADEYKYPKLCNECQTTILYYSKIIDDEIKLCSPCIKIFYINNNKKFVDCFKMKCDRILLYNNNNLYKKN